MEISHIYYFDKKHIRALTVYDVVYWMFLFNSTIYELISVREITVFLYRNFELKHVTVVMDLRCFETLGPGLTQLKNDPHLPPMECDVACLSSYTHIDVGRALVRLLMELKQ